LKYEKICQLKEKPDLLGEITSISFIDTNHFVISTIKPSKVFIYSTKGDQIKEISKIGRGPLEVINPSIVRVYDSMIFVWCNQLLKLVVFDEFGKPLKEYSNFKKGIIDFIPYKNYFCFYSGGGFKGSFIGIFDMDKRIILKEYGEITNEGRLLGMMAGAGAMTISGTNLMFVEPSQLSITSIDLNNWSQSTKKNNDIEFIVNPMNKDAVKFANSSRSKTIDYLFNNSVVTDLFPTNNGLILKAEVGLITEEKGKNDISKRYDKFYFINNNGGIDFSIKTKRDMANYNCLYTCFDGTIYNIAQYISNNEYKYVLNKLKFSNLNGTTTK
jgi:hypothetical protein